MNITADMKVCDVLALDPKLEAVFQAHSLNCAGCPGANNETLREAAAGHGICLEDLLSAINGALE